MSDNVLYGQIVEKNHLNLIKQSLSLQTNNLYEAVDADGVNYEDEYSNITPEHLEKLKPRLKRGKTREVILAKPLPEDEALWYEALKAVIERHKDELQSLVDKQDIKYETKLE